MASEKSWHSELVDRIIRIPVEERALLRFLRSLNLPKNHWILDVGCGYGRMLRLLTAEGFNAVGVDVNETIVAAVRGDGFQCMTPGELSAGDQYDVILLFHVIEHFPPNELISFVDGWLDRLSPGGHLIIATPLFSPYFYDDFDHVKPYHPTGIDMVFGQGGAQVQYYSRNILQLADIWFRRWPFRIVHSRGIFVKKGTRWAIIANLCLALLFRVTWGLIGRVEGWMGLYRKVGQRSAGE